MIENSENANPENFIADGEGAAEIRREVYGNPKFVEILKYFLPKILKWDTNRQTVPADTKNLLRIVKLKFRSIISISNVPSFMSIKLSFENNAFRLFYLSKPVSQQWHRPHVF